MERSLTLSQQIRYIVLAQSRRAYVGHIGSSLSIADLLAALYGSVINITAPNDPDRDRFILSKGHAALALYAVLSARGWLAPAELDTYCADASMLGVHPEHVLPGVDFNTGSLGQGLSMGTGAALAARLQKSKRRVFVLMSDAECNEGSVWEAIMFAAHHRLANLTVLVDLNGQQAYGYTDQVLALNPMADRWRAFGWDVHEVDGHDVDGIVRTIADLNMTDSAPHVLIAKTTFGKGVSYMERQIKWHYLPMSEEQYQQALHEIGVEA